MKADQKQQHINICEKLHLIASDDVSFLSRVIAGDESCIYSYYPETNEQFSQWKMNSKAKSMLIIFFDIKGIVHKEFVLVGQTVNFTYYCDVLGQLHETV
jgi:hypothetical protein